MYTNKIRAGIYTKKIEKLEALYEKVGNTEQMQAVGADIADLRNRRNKLLRRNP